MLRGAKNSLVLGVDPGVANMAAALLDVSHGVVVKETWLVRTKPTDTWENRFHRLFLVLQKAFSTDPGLVAVEDIHGVLYGKNERRETSLVGQRMREVVGSVRTFGHLAGVPVVDVQPVTWRTAHGIGRLRDPKKVHQRLLNLYRLPPEMRVDQSCAVAIGATGAKMWSTGRVP